MDCRDKANDKLGPSSSEKDRTLAASNMEKCVVKCVDSHLDLIPSMMARIKQTVAQQNK